MFFEEFKNKISLQAKLKKNRKGIEFILCDPMTYRLRISFIFQTIYFIKSNLSLQTNISKIKGLENLSLW